MTPAERYYRQELLLARMAELQRRWGKLLKDLAKLQK
jgi:hypothetical protein